MPKTQRTFRIDDAAPPKESFRADAGLLTRPRKMPNGFLKADAFFTRVGVFDYYNLDGTVRRELRTVEEVFKPDSMASFEMQTVTLGHPTVAVTARNSKKYSVGHSGQDVRRNVDKMQGSIMVTDEDAILSMRKGMREISNGYYCDLERTPGVTKGLEGIPDGLAYDCIQRNIVANHIAIVDRGRAGPEVQARVDSLRVDGITATDIAVSLNLDEIDSEWDLSHFDEDQDEKKPPAGYAWKNPVFDIQATSEDPTTDIQPVHLVGMMAVPLIQEKGLVLSEVAQALSVGENEVEPILSGVVFPTKLQLEGLADLIGVPVEILQGLLPERQREQLDGERQMEDFDIELNGVVFKLKGDSSAKMALTKQLGDAVSNLAAAESKADSADAKVVEVQAKLDAASEEKQALQAKLDAATDPSTVQARVDARVALETEAKKVLGEKFSKDDNDEDMRKAVILAVQPEAKLDGKENAYLEARFDAALELHSDNAKKVPGYNKTRVVLTKNDAEGAGNRPGDELEAAKARRDERNAKAWEQPMGITKDTVK